MSIGVGEGSQKNDFRGFKLSRAIGFGEIQAQDARRRNAYEICLGEGPFQLFIRRRTASEIGFSEGSFQLFFRRREFIIGAVLPFAQRLNPINVAVIQIEVKLSSQI